jgi:hypothetical protein
VSRAELPTSRFAPHERQWEQDVGGPEVAQRLIRARLAADPTASGSTPPSFPVTAASS